MIEIKTELDKSQKGHFKLYDDGKKMGEMVIQISGAILTVYHTEVLPEANGKGFAKQLLDYLVTYVREHHLKVNPLCPYVSAQFKRHPDVYNDIWLKE